MGLFISGMDDNSWKCISPFLFCTVNRTFDRVLFCFDASLLKAPTFPFSSVLTLDRIYSQNFYQSNNKSVLYFAILKKILFRLVFIIFNKY